MQLSESSKRGLPFQEKRKRSRKDADFQQKQRRKRKPQPTCVKVIDRDEDVAMVSNGCGERTNHINANDMEGRSREMMSG